MNQSRITRPYTDHKEQLIIVVMARGRYIKLESLVYLLEIKQTLIISLMTIIGDAKNAT
jgi:hypothetical protein